jgi:signal transduction histidine kinase
MIIEPLILPTKINRIQIYLILFICLFLSTSTFVKSQIDSLNNVLKTSKSDTTTILTLLRIARYQGFQNTDSMLCYSLKALEKSKSINYKKGLALSYLETGKAYCSLGLYESALENLLLAKKIYTSQKEEYGLSGVLLSIGNVYWYSEKFKEAKEIYMEALEKCKNSNNLSNKAGAYQNLGLIYGKLHKADSSIFFLKKAYHLQLETGKVPAQALTLFNIGDFYLHINKFDSAIYFYNHALEKYDKLKPSSKAKIFISLALVHLKLGNIKLAEQYIKTAYPKAEESKCYSALADYYSAAYQIDSTKGDLKNANNSLVKYYSIREKMINEKNEDKLSSFHMLYQSEKKEHEIQRLKAENEKIKFDAHKSKLRFAISVTLMLSLLIVTILVSMLVKVKAKKNKELEQKNAELNDQKKELQNLTKTLSDKNIELQSTLDQLKETKTQLIHSEKMASVGLLAAGVSHEVNTPLYHITGSLEILKSALFEFNENVKNKNYNNEEILVTIEEMVSYIHAGTKNISKIVNSLMTFAFNGKKKHTPEDIHLIIDNTLSLIHHSIPSYIQIERRYGYLPQVTCLANLMHQVFINIITNAVNALSYCTERGNEKIIIETGLSGNKTNIFIKISNTGPHISSQKIKNIFDPFFTTKEHGTGSGLGLPICYNIIVREHNGSIEVSNLDNGVEFCINLPC